MTSHTIEIRVRYAECDPMGVAHHAAFPIWFEMGRTELLRANGGDYRAMEANDQLLAVVKLDVTYRSPARYDDVLTLVTTVEKATRAKVIHTYALSRDGVLLAEASTTLACINRAGRVQPIPEALLGINY